MLIELLVVMSHHRHFDWLVIAGRSESARSRRYAAFSDARCIFCRKASPARSSLL
jgi:hypothetical protein